MILLKIGNKILNIALWVIYLLHMRTFIEKYINAVYI